MDGEAAKDSDVLTFAKYLLDIKLLDSPKGVDILESFEDGGLAIFVRACPRHKLFQVGIIVAERYVDGIGGDKSVDDLRVGGVFEKGLNDFYRCTRHTCSDKAAYANPIVGFDGCEAYLRKTQDLAPSSTIGQKRQHWGSLLS